MSRLALPGVSLLALALCVGCGNKLDGDWDGTLTFVSINGDVSVKNGPVHVHVQKDVWTVTGAPFTQCTPKVTNQGKALQVDWSGGACKFNGRKYVSPDKGKAPVELTVGQGTSSASVSDGKLTMRFVPPSVQPPSDVDAAFEIEAHRSGK